MAEELNEMCNLSDGIERKGVKLGALEATVQMVKNLMHSMRWTAQQAMDALQVAPGLRPEVLKNLS